MVKKITSILTFGLMSLGAFAQPNDMTINPTVNSPVSGCYLSANATINVFLVNTEAFPYAGTLDMGYSLNWGPPVIVTETIPTMPGNGSYNYSFPITADFSACQEHNLRVWVYSAGDANNANDTIEVTIISDCAPVVGSLSGPDTVCYGNNVDTLVLGGYTGNVQTWQVSTDGGVSWGAAPSIGTNSDSLAFTNIVNEMDVRVIVGSQWGYCPNDTTTWHNVAIHQVSDAGTLPADFDICDNGNGGLLETDNYNSQIVDWLFSTDGGATWITQGHPHDTLTWENFTQTMQIKVTAVNGVCPVDTSDALTLTYIPGTVAGTVDGPTLSCNFDNQGQIVTTGNTGDVIQWWYSVDSGATWQPSIAPPDSTFDFSNLSVSTMFAAEIQLGTCPSEFTTPHYITVKPVNMTITPDTTIIEGEAIQLYANADGATQFLWWPDEFIDAVDISDPTVEPEYDITYFVQITDIDGCSDTARVKVTVVPDLSLLLIPNLFTPNGDGYNDAWQIRNIEGFPEAEVTVFNVYGQIVFEEAPYQNNWGGDYNGSQLPDGTYFYILDLKIPETDPSYLPPFQGVITIAGND